MTKPPKRDVEAPSPTMFLYKKNRIFINSLSHLRRVVAKPPKRDVEAPSPTMFLYEKNRIFINSLSPLGRVVAKPPREVLQPDDYRVSSVFTVITAIVLTSIFIPSIRFASATDDLSRYLFTSFTNATLPKGESKII